MFVLGLLLASACRTAPDVSDSATVAEFTAACVGLACDFEAEDATRLAVSWFWSFGDGATSASRNPSHAYPGEGVFDVTLTVVSVQGDEVSHTAQVSLAEVPPEGSADEITELDYQTSEAGRFVTRWNHPDPAILFTIEDGWWAADTLTTLHLSSLTERGTTTCDPLVKIVAPEAWYDAGRGAMATLDDPMETLTADPRLQAGSVTDETVGGYPAERLDALLDEDQVESRWRGCGNGVKRMFPAAAFDAGDPAYRWVWLPAESPHLSIWVVDVVGVDMFVLASYGDRSSLEELERLVASLEFRLASEPELTRTLHTVLGSIEIYSGTPTLHGWTDWAVSRFAASEVGSPEVRSVTFSAIVECRERGYSGGFTETSNGSIEVHLCFGEERADLAARLTLLHEFAHAWLIAADVDGSTIEEVMAGLDGAVSEPRQLLGSAAPTEVAADLIVWGLQDGSVVPPSLAEASCDGLASAFRLLTGADPLTDLDGCR